MLGLGVTPKTAGEKYLASALAIFGAVRSRKILGHKQVRHDEDISRRQRLVCSVHIESVIPRCAHCIAWPWQFDAFK